MQRENREIYGEDKARINIIRGRDRCIEPGKKGRGVDKRHKYSVRAKLVKRIEIGEIKC